MGLGAVADTGPFLQVPLQRKFYVGRSLVLYKLSYQFFTRHGHCERVQFLDAEGSSPSPIRTCFQRHVTPLFMSFRCLHLTPS